MKRTLRETHLLPGLKKTEVSGRSPGVVVAQPFGHPLFHATPDVGCFGVVTMMVDAPRPVKAGIADLRRDMAFADGADRRVLMRTAIRHVLEPRIQAVRPYFGVGF